MSEAFARSALRIQTPEGVSFALPLAGLTARFLALIIDLCAVGAALSLLSQLAAPFALVWKDQAGAILALVSFGTYSFYHIALEYLWNGQTLGKKILGIRVADIHGLRLTFSQVVVRNLFRAVDGFPLLYLVGGVSMLLTPYMQRLGDLAGNTVVLSARQPRRPAIDQLGAVMHNSLREYPWVEARLRQRTSPEEAALLVQSLLRRDELEAADRVALFGELAAHFRSKTKLPDAATSGVTDEQFLRSLVDSLFRDKATADK